MRRITMWLVSTVAAVILLFSYKTSTSGPGGFTSAQAASNNGAGIVSGPGAAAGGTPTPTPTGGASASSSGSGSSQNTVVNGSVAQTRWGPVQVQVTISGNKIVDISVLQQPDGNGRDMEINGYALPVLKQQVLSAQSASIDGVSGATVTSDGYRESLQAALDAAHFKS